MTDVVIANRFVASGSCRILRVPSLAPKWPCADG
jgi:hypothetical protein